MLIMLGGDEPQCNEKAALNELRLEKKKNQTTR